MYILGDIGNSETKVYLVNSKKQVIKNINFLTKKINNDILNKKFRYFIKDFKFIEKVLFCSVVPKTFNKIKKFLKKNTYQDMTNLINLLLKKKYKVEIFPLHETWTDYGLKKNIIKHQL